MSGAVVDRLYFERLGVERFDRMMRGYDVERRLALVFDRLLAGVTLRDRDVLEVGCGTGRFSAPIVGAEARLTVLDIGARLVGEVVRRCGCAGVVGDACALAFDAQSFDAVVSSECIEHTTDPEQALREMCRVLRPGGVLCVTTPNRLWYPVHRLAECLGLREFEGPERWITPHRAAAILRAAGLTDVVFDGCHLWPHPVAPWLLRRLDVWSDRLYPVMTNFGVRATKPRP